MLEFMYFRYNFTLTHLSVEQLIHSFLQLLFKYLVCEISYQDITDVRECSAIQMIPLNGEKHIWEQILYILGQVFYPDQSNF